MQKGFLSVWVLVGIILVGGLILFAPIPYYVTGDKFVCLGSNCPKHGWNLGLSLWQRITALPIQSIGLFQTPDQPRPKHYR